MRRMVQVLCASVVAFLIVLARCSSGPIAGAPGTGQETTNGIAALAVHPDGSPAADAAVRLRRSDYLTQTPGVAKAALLGADALTDSSGRFAFTDVDPGSYRIEVNDGRSALLLACTLGVGDTVDIGTATLRPYATITGVIDSATGPAYIQVYGLERLARTDSAGRFTLTGLPPGSLRLRIAGSGAAAPAIEVANVKTISGETTAVEADPDWRFVKRLYLNTTVTGAGVSKDVAAFPLLVRLTAPSFDFTQARASGQDLRFAKSNGIFLPHDVERWDPAAGRADIWVRIDTVYGNNDLQFITMLWGNPSVASQSNGAAVFDTADGFAGVWHLSENPSGGTGAVRDRTLLHQDATANGNIGIGDLVEGAAGPCLRFDGVDDYLVTQESSPIAVGAGPVSISAWVKFRPGDNAVISVRGIEGKEGRRLRLRFLDGMLRFGVHDLDKSSNVLTWVESGSGASVLDSLWHNVAVVFERGTRAVAYFDGNTIDSIDLSPLSVTLDSAMVNVGYDEFAPGSFASGAIDEVRFVRRAMGFAVVRLGYMNQRQDDRLLK